VKTYLWTAGAVLLAAAALAVWIDLRDPTFVTTLTIAAVGAAVKAAWPFLGSSAASRAKAEKSAREGLDGTHPGRPG
jgi:hypothetical protein